jgi:hypothetical protein
MFWASATWAKTKFYTDIEKILSKVMAIKAMPCHAMVGAWRLWVSILYFFTMAP